MGYKVFIPQDISNAGKEYLIERGYEVVVGLGAKIDLNGLEEYDAFLARAEIYDKKVIDAAKKLKVIGRYGVGFDNIDVDYCTEKGIQITYAPTANMVSVAEYTIMMILKCAKNDYEVTKLFRKDGDFNLRNTHCGMELDGKVLGIFGFGRIGQMVAKKAFHGFSMKIVVYDPFIVKDKVPQEFIFADSNEEVLRQADFITVHVPSMKETKNMLAINEFRMMKKNAYLINASRGGVVNEPDLILALRDNVIAGAAIDVFDEEPASLNNPLFSMDNVIVSPHIAGMTVESADRVGIHAAMGIDEVLSGRKPSWPVNQT